MTNQFINNQEPIKNRQREIEETINRSAAQVLKLNPPVFEDATKDHINHKVNRITLSMQKVL